jgi:hypothetical protein
VSASRWLTLKKKIIFLLPNEMWKHVAAMGAGGAMYCGGCLSERWEMGFLMGFLVVNVSF